MSTIDILGLTAGALTSMGFIPQVMKALKTKSTKDLSAQMLLILFAGVILWLIYGLILKDLPLIAANSVTLVSVSFLIFLKLFYR